MEFLVIDLLLLLMSMLLLKSGLLCVPMQSSVTHRISYESWLASRGLMLSPFHVRWQTTMFNRLFAHCARINPRALFLWCGALLHLKPPPGLVSVSTFVSNLQLHDHLFYICSSFQVQQRPAVWYICHVGLSGPAGQDSAADAGSNDNKQPPDGGPADPAGGGM